MQKELDDYTLEELYLLLLNKGPDYNTNIEFWDPTCDALIIFEEISNKFNDT